MNIGMVFGFVVALAIGWAASPAIKTWHENKYHDFYFSCKEKNSDEYVVKLNNRPRQDGMTYFLDDDIVYIQKPDSYCRVLRDDKVTVEPIDK